MSERRRKIQPQKRKTDSQPIPAATTYELFEDTDEEQAEGEDTQMPEITIVSELCLPRAPRRTVPMSALPEAMQRLMMNPQPMPTLLPSYEEPNNSIAARLYARSRRTAAPDRSESADTANSTEDDEARPPSVNGSVPLDSSRDASQAGDDVEEEFGADPADDNPEFSYDNGEDEDDEDVLGQNYHALDAPQWPHDAPSDEDEALS